MAIVNATDVILELDTSANENYTKLFHATSANLSVSREMRDSTTKDSGGFSTSLAGLKSYEISGDGFVDISTNSNLETDELIDQMLADSPKVTLRFTIGNAGKQYTGEGFISSFSIDAGVEENATYSLTITGSGTLTSV